MRRRCVAGRVNWKLVIVLVVVAGALVAGAFLARDIRRQIIGNAALAAGQEALKHDPPDYAEGVKQLAEYLARYPENVEVLKQYAEANLKVRPLEAGNLLGAIDAYRRVLRLSAADESVYKPLATLYTMTGNTGELAHIAGKRLEQAAGDPDATLWLARSLLAANSREQRDEARKLLDNPVEPLGLLQRTEKRGEKSPQHLRVCELLSEIAIASGTDSESSKAAALKWLDRAVQYDPQSPEAYVLRARFCRVNGQTKDQPVKDRMAASRADLMHADGLKPADPRVRLALAEEWLQHDEPARTADELKAVDSLSDDVVTSYEILDPADVKARVFLIRAELLARKGTAVEGVALADSALAALTGKRHRSIMLPVAVDLYAASGKASQARACLDEYAEITRAQTAAEPREKTARLEAVVARAEGNHRRVIEVLEPIVTAGAPDARLWLLLGDAYRQAGQSQLAVWALGECHRASPRSAAAAAELAGECRKLGRWNEVLEAATEAEKLGADDLATRLLAVEAVAVLAPGWPEAARKTELERAAKELAALRKDHSDSTQVRLLQAVVTASQGRLDEAAAALKTLAKECPDADKLSVELTLVRLYANAQRTAEAIAACRAACEHHKKVAAPWVALSELLAANSQFDEARAQLSEGLKAVEVQADRRTLAIQSAMLNISHGDRKAGIQQFKDLAGAAKDDAAPRLMLLDLPEVLADEPQAQTLVDEVHKIQGTGSLAWQYRQALLWLTGPHWREKQKEAGDLLARCLTVDPKWPAPALLLASMYERLNDAARAEAVYRQALTANAGATEVADRLMSMLERTGRFAEARTVLGQVDRRSPALDDHAWRIALGEGNATKAIDELKRTVTRNPQDVDARISLARLIYTQNKDVNGAMKLLDEVEAMAAASLVPTAVKVAILEKEGRRAEARQVLDKRIATAEALDAKAGATGPANGNALAAYLLRADYLMSIGEVALAEKDYVHVASLDGKADGAVRLARFYSDAGRPDDAIKSLEASAQRYPDNDTLKDRLMRALLSRNGKGDNQRAVGILGDLERRQPDDPGVLGVRALVLLGEGSEESTRKAQQLLERVTQLTPTAVDAHLALYQLAMQRRDYAASRDLIIRAQGANPRDTRLVLARATTEGALGNLPMTRELARGVLKDEPDNTDAMEVLVNSATASRDAKAIEEAQAVLDGALRKRPDNERLQLLTARVLTARDQKDAAIARLDAFIRTEAGRSSTAAVLTLAELYRSKGDLAKAGQMIDRAAELTPASTRVLRERFLWLGAQKKLDDIVAQTKVYRTKEDRGADVMMTAASILAASATPAHLKEAAALYDQVAEDVPQFPAARIGRAQMAYKAGDVDQAERLYRKVLESNPKDAQVLNDLAWILADTHHDYKAALDLADKGVALAPGNIYLRDTRGVILMNLPNRLRDARTDFEKQVELAADPPRRAKALMQLGRVCVKLGDVAQAKIVCGEALKIDGEAKVLSPQERAEMNQILQVASGNG